VEDGPRGARGGGGEPGGREAGGGLGHGGVAGGGVRGGGGPGGVRRAGRLGVHVGVLSLLAFVGSTSAIGLLAPQSTSSMDRSLSSSGAISSSCSSG
jgi:hypothetical protein